MINKFFRRILNRQLKFFSLFLLLKHTIIFFTVITIIFFSIPKLFDYEKKKNLIKNYLLDKYTLETSNIDSIKYQIFPLPNLTLKDINFSIQDGLINSSTKNLKIYLNFKNILTLKDLNAKKLVLEDAKLEVEIENYRNFLEYMHELNERLKVKNLDLSFKKDNNLLFKLKDIHFSNYGFKRSNVVGKIFEKKFKINFKNNNNEINFKILEAGVDADFFF